MLFYLFYFNKLSFFLCCSEAGCSPVVCAYLKQKEVNAHVLIVIFNIS
ncbi:hypothetical protein GVT56_18485, partial [Salmonella enterica]|nr:hypothetical protein [Salmonella enterica]EDZ3762684.1 hypothetical protein [Salmonella enterica]